MSKYDDILDEKWIGVREHNHMSLENRAKIFLPFAALRGFEEAIEAKNRIIVSKEELSEYEASELDKHFNILCERVKNKEHPEVKLVYFVKNRKDEEGEYVQVNGLVSKIDIDARYIQIVNEKIALDSIASLEI